jgi:hypothetical protein
VRPKSRAIVVTLPMQSDSGRAVSAVNFVLIIYEANELRKERWPDDQCGAQEASLSLLYRGGGIQAYEGSLQRSADMRKLRAHYFPK